MCILIGRSEARLWVPSLSRLSIGKWEEYGRRGSNRVMPQPAPKNGAALPLAGTFIGRHVRVDVSGTFANQKVSVIPFHPRFGSPAGLCCIRSVQEG